MSSKLLARDLGRHLRERLMTVVEDELDTARRVNLSKDARYGLALHSLLHLSSMLALMLGADRRDFLAACAETYEHRGTMEGRRR